MSNPNTKVFTYGYISELGVSELKEYENSLVMYFNDLRKLNRFKVFGQQDQEYIFEVSQTSIQLISAPNILKNSNEHVDIRLNTIGEIELVLVSNGIEKDLETKAKNIIKSIILKIGQTSRTNLIYWPNK